MLKHNNLQHFLLALIFPFLSYSGNLGIKRKASNQQTGTSNFCKWKEEWNLQVRINKNSSKVRAADRIQNFMKSRSLQGKSGCLYNEGHPVPSLDEIKIPLGHLNSLVTPEIKPFSAFLFVCTLLKHRAKSALQWASYHFYKLPVLKPQKEQWTSVF